MLKVKQFSQYAYAPCGVVFNGNSANASIMWDSAERDALNQFDQWRKTVKKESIVSITGPLHEILQSGCGLAVVKVMYEDEP